MRKSDFVRIPSSMALLALLSFAVGCGDDEEETTTDTGTTDTGSDTGSGSGEDTGTTDTGTTDTGTDTTVTENTKIRVFHASDLANTASEAGVDIYTGDTLVVDALAYRFGTGFLEVPAGDYAFNVFADGAGPTGDAALAIPSLSYAANEAYTLVAYDDAGAIAPLRLDESTATIGAGNIRVRAIHAAGILPEVDIWNVTDAANPSVLFENLAFGAATAQVEIPAAAYVLGIDLNNDATPDVTFDVPALPAGTSANIFAIVDAAGPHLVADLGAGEAVELLGQETAGETNIRVFHGAPSAGAVDIYTGGNPVIPGLEALSATNYVTVPEGDYAFDVFAAGADPTGTPAFSIPSLNYAADASYTAVAYESGAGFAALRLDEPGIEPAAGNIRVRAVHIANGVGQVDIWNITDPTAPTPLIVDFNFGTATDFLEIPAQAYTLGLDVNNDATPDLTFSIPPLPAGTVANLYAIVGADGPFLAGQLGTTVVPIFPDAGPTNIRVFHASTIANGASAPGVDIYTGGALTVPNFTYLSATDYLSVPAGDYSFDVFAAGVSTGTPALAIPSLAYDADAFYTLVAYDNTGSIAGIRLDDDASPIAAGSARVQIVHVADTIPQVDVLNIDSLGAATALLTDLSFGTSSGTLDIPAGAYTVGLDVNNDLAADVIFTLPELTSGANATVYAIKDATGPFLAVQLGTTVLGPIRPNL